MNPKRECKVITSQDGWEADCEPFHVVDSEEEEILMTEFFEPVSSEDEEGEGYNEEEDGGEKEEIGTTINHNGGFREIFNRMTVVCLENKQLPPYPERIKINFEEKVELSEEEEDHVFQPRMLNIVMYSE